MWCCVCVCVWCVCVCVCARACVRACVCVRVEVYTLTGHFIRYTLLVPGWTPFAFRTALILDIDSTRCWKHSSEILVHIDMIASRSCCRFVGCTSMMRISQMCSIALRPGDCGGHLSKMNSFSSGSQRRRSLSLPVLTLIFPALLPCLVRDFLCTALQTKILWINWSLNAIDTIETWVSGNLTAPTERSQPAIRWRVGEVANRVSCGSFRGGHWYLPIRNHDNRYFADWIRLCPGLSKNSENGNSCPKPHKAARMIEAVGRAVSIETETIIAIWILPRRSSRLYKGKLIKMETKMVKMDRE